MQTALAPIREEDSPTPRLDRDDVGLLMTTLAGLEIPMNSDIRYKLITAPLLRNRPATSTALTIQYREAVEDNRIGEALLIGLIVLQPGAQLSSDTLGLFVDAPAQARIGARRPPIGFIRICWIGDCKTAMSALIELFIEMLSAERGRITPYIRCLSA